MIKTIAIENYKCFKTLEVDNLSNINLITGKNNVGKTAFMEIAYLATRANNFLNVIGSLKNILVSRNNFYDLDFFNAKESDFSACINGKKVLTVSQIDNSYPISIRVNDNDIKVENLLSQLPQTIIHSKEPMQTSTQDTKSNFIFSSIINKDDLARYYAKVIENFQEEALNRSLSIFDPAIKSLKMIPAGSTIFFKIQVDNSLILLNSFGDGISRFITILCAIWASKDGYLFIDEIENGIHHTKLKLLWELIFQNAKEANVQIFATTHSKECVEAFNTFGEENSRLLEFYYSDKIEVKIRDSKQLQYSLEIDGEFRGE